MKKANLVAAALDPSVILSAQGMDVDPWQRDLLISTDKRIFILCSRQAGKSTVVSAKALHKALFQPRQTVLLISPGQRQSGELFRKVLNGYNALGRPIRADYETQLKIELANGSRIICLPGKEETIRGYSPDLIIIDEAARVLDDLYRSIRPMLAVTKGQLIALSTPWGQRGWFYEAWKSEDQDWKRIIATWKSCPRILPEFIEEERRALGDAWVQQEYECLFTALEGLVYPNFTQTYSDFYAPLGKRVGGIDWGWRNPFAAEWGVLDAEDVLWIQEERYLKQTGIHEHASALPKGVVWYCDPAGPTEIEEFRVAGHIARKANNDIRLGIAAVNARIRTGRLKIHPARCPAIVEEAKLYRYPNVNERQLMGEKPIDEHNHALSALRYLISRLDARFIAKLRGSTTKSDAPIDDDDIEEIIKRKQDSLTKQRVDANVWDDPALWQPLN